MISKKIMKLACVCSWAVFLLCSSTTDALAETITGQLKDLMKVKESEIVANAKTGDTDAQLKAFIYFATVGGVKEFKPYYIALLGKKSEQALLGAVQYNYNANDPDFAEIVELTKKEYHKEKNSLVGLYLACMLLSVEREAEAIELFSKHKNPELYTNELFGMKLIKSDNNSYRNMAINLLEEAAQRGSSSASSIIGMFYYNNGEKAKGIKYLEALAKKGDQKSSEFLCLIYLGDKELLNSKKAFHYAKLAYEDNENGKLASVTLEESKTMGKYLQIKFQDGNFKMIGVQI